MLPVWIGFLTLILIFLMLDLGVFHRKAHVISIREALAWFAVWVTVALLFNVAIYFFYEHKIFGLGLDPRYAVTGSRAALEFFTGYLLEESLSVDNMFVMAMIFSFFGVPAKAQHRVLFWGIVGAMVMRGIIIAFATELVGRFEWVLYIFGVLLILSAVKMLLSSDQQIDPNRNPLVRIARRLYPVTPGFHDQKFFVRMGGKRAITPLFLVLLVIESTDLLFAVDSIPAVIGVTRDPFIVFTSNIFAILGLRSIYFALAGMMHRFRYLKLSLVFLLAFIGAKMLMIQFFHIPIAVSLTIIGCVLAVGVIASLVAAHRGSRAAQQAITQNVGDAARFAWRHARRVVILIVGGTVLLVGVALVFLPGPAFVVIPIGLGILAVEFVWAQRLLAQARHRFDQVSGGSTAAGAFAMSMAGGIMLLVGYAIWLGAIALAVRRDLGPGLTWDQWSEELVKLIAAGIWQPVPAAVFSSYGVGLLLSVIGAVLAIRSIRKQEAKRRLALAGCAIGVLVGLAQVASIVCGLIVRTGVDSPL